MTELPLIAEGDLDAPLARRGSVGISRRQYLADAAALAERLPARGTMLNLSLDRYRFAVGFAAALLRGQTSLLPPNHLPDTLARLRARFADVYALVEGDDEAPRELPLVRHAAGAAPTNRNAVIPRIESGLLAAQVLTSGSTGEPMPHAKPWGLLVQNVRGAAARLAESIGRADLGGVTLVATVPPQHMYGFESSVLLGLHGGAAFDAARPFFPADVAARLAAAPTPRVLVTTPFHLRALLDAEVDLPRLALVVCATAPLAPQLAARAEAAFGAPLVEIYGCTEAGQVATRQTTSGPEWRVFSGLAISGDGADSVVSGGHVLEPVRLADVLEVTGPQTFRLLGRSNDIVNVAGKRSSLAHLNFHLNSLPGVADGAFWMPADDASAASVARSVAFVVAPGIDDRTIVAGLRERIDAVFLPRRIVRVEALPRDATGKLPAARLAALAIGPSSHA